ncbi:unnamed protein product [Hyaloperonospora brassicae]|uniref:Decapping nuclease n=1 Tax=Hyaloperonospora brassicae TaxID=162125 RepID=A0AAV0U952_HYABA|nr:unnamed protein product [Hyaloperonospora brassicae]
MPKKRQRDVEATTDLQRRRDDRSTIDPNSSVPPLVESNRFNVLRAYEILQHDRVALSKPQEIAYFSTHGDHSVHFDRSNLAGANLLDGFEGFTSKDEKHPTAPSAPIAPLLAALEHFQGNNSQRWKQPHFVTYRNNLNKIMGTPYNSKSSWAFDVEKRNGCVYLNVRKTQQDMDSVRNPHENQRRGAFAGRRFEIYSTQSNASARNSNKERVVNEDEEYCSISSMTLGDKRLVVAAEIDCCADKSSASREYIELKTFRLLQRGTDRFVFERFKLLAFWIQSFLVGTPTLVVAFRDDEFRVQKLQTFRVTDIPSFCRNYWSPVVCLNFTNALLDWIYARAMDRRVYRVTYTPRQHVVEMTEVAAETSSFLPAQS